MSVSSAGCETLALKAGEALVGASSKGGVSANTELTVGQKKENNVIETSFGNQSTQEASSITNNVDMNIPFWVIIIIIFLAGWAIPDPKTTMSFLTKNFIKR